jgi:hypothetical protein
LEVGVCQSSISIFSNQEHGIILVHPVLRSPDDDEVRYLTIASTNQKHEYNAMVLVGKDRNGTLANADFQYGKVVIKTYETSIKCHRGTFKKVKYDDFYTSML